MRLRIKDVIIINKLIIFKDNFLTIYNITRVIYKYQDKLHLRKIWVYKTYYQTISSIDKTFEAIFKYNLG